MPENEHNGSFDPDAYIRMLVADPSRLRDRFHNSESGGGMLVAAAAANRYERIGRRGANPNVVVDNYISTTVHALSGKITNPQALESMISMVLQLWYGYFTHQDTESLLSAAVQQRMADLPTQAHQYGITSEKAQQVSQNFQRLITAPQQSP